MLQLQDVTGVALDEAAVQVSQLLSTDVSGWVVGGFEVQVVLPVAEELGGSHIHADDDLVWVSGLLDGRLQQLQSCEDRNQEILAVFVGEHYCNDRSVCMLKYHWMSHPHCSPGCWGRSLPRLPRW